MVDMEWKTKMQGKSPRLSSKLQISIPLQQTGVPELTAASESSCSAYEHYIRLPELNHLWLTKDFIGWKSELIFRPAFMALEITFRFISTTFSDPRPYVSHKEWTRHLESLATDEIELVALLCEGEEEDPATRGTIPIVDVMSSGVLARENSSAEVWNLSEGTMVVSRMSEASLLPRLAAWQKAEKVAQKIQYSIECQMRGCPYTLGLGEPNLSGKQCIDYDAVCKPTKLHTLKKSPSEGMNLKNHENQTLYTTHQILELWIRVAQLLLERISEKIGSGDFDSASKDCWILEKIWKILNEIEELHLIMDPDDFLRLKNQLSIKATSESELFCFRSRGLIEITKKSKDLKHKVPAILDVEVDPTGGPRLQDAAMNLFMEKEECTKIHLLQALQALEMAVKRFYFSYKQLLVIVMGSLEARGNGNTDLLAQIYLEPTYFPSLDAAKTFLGDYYLSQEKRRHSPERPSEEKF